MESLVLSITFCSISAAVFLVVSKFSTSAVSPKIFAPALDSLESKSSSKPLSIILKSFCCLVRSAYKYANSCPQKTFKNEIVFLDL